MAGILETAIFTKSSNFRPKNKSFSREIHVNDRNRRTFECIFQSFSGFLRVLSKSDLSYKHQINHSCHTLKTSSFASLETTLNGTFKGTIKSMGLLMSVEVSMNPLSTSTFVCPRASHHNKSKSFGTVLI